MTNSEKFSIDSNLLVYLISGDAAKGQRAEEIILSRPIMSVQVLNEFAAVARRKYKKSFGEIQSVVQLARKAAAYILPVTMATHERALTIAFEADIGIYDANIVAAAELSGCDILYTEDLNHSQRIGHVEIRNPFLTE